MNLDPAAFVADSTLVDGLEVRSAPVHCEADRVLFRQGDAPVGVFILKSGQVTLTMASAASSETVSVAARPGSLLGLPGLIGNQPYTLSATAHAGAELGFLDRDAFTALMGSEPALAFKVLQVLAAEVRSAREAMIEQQAAPRRRGRLTHAPQA